MGKNQSASNLTNIVKYDNNGNLTFVSGSSTLLSVSSSGALTTNSTITATTLVVQTITSSISAITGSTKFGQLISNTHQFTGSLYVSGGINLNSGSLLVGTNSSIWSNGSTRGVVEINGPTQAVLGFDVNGSGAGYLYHDGYNMTLNNGLNGYLRLLTNGTEVMRITGSNVGIGTSDPTYLLHAYSTGASNARIYLQGTTNFVTTQLGNTGGAFYMAIDSSTGGGFGTEAYARLLYSTGAYPMIFFTNGSERMRITSGGNVLINRTTSFWSGINSFEINGTETLIGMTNGSTSYGYVYHNGTNLYISNERTGVSGKVIFNNNGNERMRIDSLGYLYCLGVYTQAGGASANVVVASDGSIYRSTSSLKYKKNVEDYDKGLDIVNQIRPVYYQSINENESEIKYAGFIAEEIDQLGLTEFVQYAEDGTPDALHYPNMIALLTKAIQELKAEIDELKNNK